MTTPVLATSTACSRLRQSSTASPQTGQAGKALLCKPLKIDWTFYCHKCDGMASLRTCPHSKEDRVILSGTKLRKALSDGAEIVDHFGREEVLVHPARVLCQA